MIGRLQLLMIVVLVALATAGSGCRAISDRLKGKSNEAEAAASASVAPVALPPETAAPPAPPAPTRALSTPEQFEEEAFEKISAATMKDELARIEKEIKDAAVQAKSEPAAKTP